MVYIGRGFPEVENTRMLCDSRRITGAFLALPGGSAPDTRTHQRPILDPCAAFCAEG
jgi:hypothetical protein